MNLDLRRNLLLLLSVALTIAIFGFDLAVETGVAAAVPYVIVVWLAYAARSSLGVKFAMAICSLLTIVGVPLSPSGGEFWKVMVNRGLTMVAICVTGLVCLQVLRLLAEQSERALSAEKAVTDATRGRDLHARKSRAMLSIMEDLRIERGRLEASEHRFRTTIESAPTAMVMIDSGGRVTLVNAETEKLFGYSRDELLGRPLEVLVPERFRSAHEGYRSGFFEEPETRRMGAGRDLYGLRKDGSEFPIEIGLNPMDTNDGLFVLSAIVDISERKQQERALRQSEERIRSILDAALDAVVTMNDKGLVTGWNPQAEVIFGWSRDEVFGRPLAELIIPPSLRAAHWKGLERFLKTGLGPVLDKRLELCAVRRGGEEFPVELTISPIRSGSQFEFSAFVRDITDRKRLQQRFRATVESAPTAMVMIDRQGKIVLVNHETETLFGYDREELLEQPVELLVPLRFRAGHPRYREEFFAGPVARRMGAGRDLFGRRRNGTEFPIEIGLNPIETDEGLFVLSAIVDITERKLAENEINRINEELRRKNDEMQQFVYTVSHDLKAPLVTCKGFVGLMKEDAEEGRWDDMLDSVARIEHATQRMGNLIDDLLELSRIGVIRNEPTNVDVNNVLRAIKEELSPRFQDIGASFVVEDEIPSVVADPMRLVEVFENLVGNAMKYGCRGDAPKVMVGGERCNGEVRYFVRDNGPGIAKEYHERIFDLFQRLETDQDGTGVGLAAVERIMQSHGGRAWVESEAGAGATFWIAFPQTIDEQHPCSRKD